MVEIAQRPDFSSHKLEHVALARNIGTEFRGVRLSGDLSPEVVAEIRGTVLKRKVVFFRDQHHLDDEGQRAFTELFGELHQPVVKNGDNSPGVLELTGGYHASAWHADLTFMPDPLAFLVLRPVMLPTIGGDTMWANAATAYQSLPQPLKLLADNLWAIQASDFDLEGAFNQDILTRISKSSQAHGNVMRQQLVVQTEHPVVVSHAETGERSLLLGPYVKRFVGLNNADSAKILEILQSYITVAENTVRWIWRAGDVAMWDNRSTQHRAVPDHGDAERVLRRTASRGTMLSGIDGRSSRRLES